MSLSIKMLNISCTLSFVVIISLLCRVVYNDDLSSPESHFLERLTLKPNSNGYLKIHGCPSKFVKTIDKAIGNRNSYNQGQQHTVTLLQFDIICSMFDNTFILNPSSGLSQVQELWINQAWMDDLDNPYRVQLTSRTSFPVTALHIINIKFLHGPAKFQFLSGFPNLEVLQLNGPHILNEQPLDKQLINTLESLPEVTAALRGICTMQVLSFDAFQGHGQAGERIMSQCE